jgi:F-type H+-transporting ATPase subunit b
MIDNNFFLIATEKTGGLFDLDGTLPLVAIQFLVLMVVLNLILYTPILSAINDRNHYITENLAKASQLLAQANHLTTQYENELAKARKEAQIEISTSQKFYKEILEIESRTSQKYIDEFLGKITTNFNIKKQKLLTSLETEIDSISNQIISKILA